MRTTPEDLMRLSAPDSVRAAGSSTCAPASLVASRTPSMIRPAQARARLAAATDVSAGRVGSLPMVSGSGGGRLGTGIAGIRHRFPELAFPLGDDRSRNAVADHVG